MDKLIDKIQDEYNDIMRDLYASRKSVERYRRVKNNYKKENKELRAILSSMLFSLSTDKKEGLDIAIKNATKILNTNVDKK